ncbi:MAG TPA: phage portal protein [Emticicia sp.]
MGFLGFGASNKKTINTAADSSANLYNQLLFSIPYRGMPITTEYNLYEYTKTYSSHSLVYALIDWKAGRASEIRPCLYQIKDKTLAKEYRKFNGIYINDYERKQLATLKERCYQEIDLSAITTTDLTYGKIKKLFRQPAPLFTWKQFVYHYMASRDVAGFCVIWANRVSNSLSKVNIESLNPLPSQLVQIIGGTQFDPIRGYKIINATYSKEFKAEDSLLLRNHSFNYDNQGGFLYGTPRIQAALNEIDTYKASKLRELYGFQTGDSTNILFPRDKELSEAYNQQSPQEKQHFKDVILRIFGQKNRQNVAVSGFPLDAIRLDAPLSESRTQEAQKSIREVLGAVWHINPVLLGSQEASSYNNIKEVSKISLRDGVFPEMRELCEALNDFLVTPFLKDHELEFDYDVFEEFSQDIKFQSEALKNMDFLSDNEKRAWLDYGPLADAKADLPQRFWENKPL